jgi:hypothetical protein
VAKVLLANHLSLTAVDMPWILSCEVAIHQAYAILPEMLQIFPAFNVIYL